MAAWFRKEKKPRAPRTERLEIPADVWEKCEACGHTDIREKFLRNFSVCPTCDYHRRLRAIDYARLLFDEDSWTETEPDIRSTDPLQFPDYQARIKKARLVADYDAILTAAGTMVEMPVGIGIMDFAFMGGSMGSVVGEKISRLANRSLEKKHPLIIVSASGGARMQEGVLSLMQMAKVSAVLSQLAERRIPVRLDPDQSHHRRRERELRDAGRRHPRRARRGDRVCGPRVIKQTLGQDLPEGFQTAEFLLDHGMLDAVVHRRDLKTTVGRLLRHMSGKPAVAGWATA